jgi:hypothetical protein
VLALEFEKVEGEIGEMSAPAVRDLLHDLEGGHTIRSDAAEFAVDIGHPDLELREGRGGRRILRRPVEARSGQELHPAVLDTGGHAIAV